MSDNSDELQKKQLFAQRVTAAAATATAIAAAKSAASLENMRREAQDAAENLKDHNSRMENLALKQAAKENAEREFRRDIIWLERSDPKGRFDFLATKVKDDFIAAFTGRLYSDLTLTDIGTEAKLARLTSVFDEFVTADERAIEKADALSIWQKRLAEANELIENSAGLGFVKFGCLPIAILMFLLAVRVGWKSRDLLGPVWAFGFVVLAILILAVYRSKKRKGSAQKAEIEPKVYEAQREAEYANGLRQNTLIQAKLNFVQWIKSCETDVAKYVQNRIESGDASLLLLQLVNVEQAKYPPLCRIDLKAIDSASVKTFLMPLEATVTGSALRVLAEPNSIVSEIRRQKKITPPVNSSDWIDLLNEVVSTAGPTKFTVILKEAPNTRNFINELVAIMGLSRGEAMSLIDVAPKPIKENVRSREAEEIKRKLEAAGAKVELI